VGVVNPREFLVVLSVDEKPRTVKVMGYDREDAESAAVGQIQAEYKHRKVMVPKIGITKVVSSPLKPSSSPPPERGEGRFKVDFAESQ
jgi:hypothetical protein